MIIVAFALGLLLGTAGGAALDLYSHWCDPIVMPAPCCHKPTEDLINDMLANIDRMKKEAGYQ